MGKDTERTFIFIVTKDCQFRCRYCYVLKKNSYEVMSLEIGKSAIDYILSNPYNEETVVLDFIGGEPLIEIGLINQICTYFVGQLSKCDHIWFNNYIIRITTNGLLYGNSEVQSFLAKFNGHISISISLDGTKRKNDINRVFVSGKGTYDAIIENVKLWITQYPNSESRMTISHEDLPYIKESVIHLFELGIKNIDVRIVNEDVWKEGDDIIYENQLIELANYLLSDTTIDCHLSCFHEEKGMPISKNIDISCGNKVIAIDSLGNLYPCHRFASYSLRTKKPLIIGDIFKGIDKNKMRAFASFDSIVHNTKECNECSICGDCRFCLAEDYDSAHTNTIFQHSTAICRMHKAEVRAYNYYWRNYYLNMNYDRQ